MPLTTPIINTSIDTPTINNPNRDALLKLLGIGLDNGGAIAGKMIAQGQQNKFENANADTSRQKLASFITAHPNDEYKDPQGAQASPSPGIQLQKLQQGQQDKFGKNYQDLDKAYQGIKKKYEPILTRVQNGMDSISRNDSLGMAQAAINLAGSVEGQGQRILQSAIQKLGGDPAIAGSSEKLMNFIDGGMRAGKADAYKQALSNAFSQIGGNLKNNYESDMQEFQQKAPALGQYAATYDSAFKDKVGSYGSDMTRRFAGIAGQTNAANSAIKPDPSAGLGSIIGASNPGPAAGTNETSSLSSMLGFGPKQPQAPQSAAPQQPGARIRVKLKSTGAMGTIPSHEYDPALYDKAE